MNKIVRKDILAILSKISDILDVEEERDIQQLMELSNHTIHNSSIFQDEDSISIAILVYSISKILARNKIGYSPFRDLVGRAHDKLEKKNIEAYRYYIKELFKLIKNTDSKFRIYIQEVINQSEIKKAGRVYAHGISIGRAAEILGISQWDLLIYIGQTTLPEVEEKIVNVTNRLNLTRGLFA